MPKRFFLAPVVLTPLVAVENVPAQTVRLNPPAKIYRDKIEANWFTRGNDTNNAFWYRLNLAEGKREFVLVDAVRGTRQPAFDHARVAAALAQLLNRAVEAANLPVESIEFDRDGKTIFLHGAADWKLDLESYTVTPRGEVAMEKSLPANSRIHPSRDCGEETQIIFVNHLKEEVNVFWVDGGGERIPYGSPMPDGRREQHTFAGHVWLVTNRSGDVLSVFDAVETTSTAVIGTPVEKSPQRA